MFLLPEQKTLTESVSALKLTGLIISYIVHFRNFIKIFIDTVLLSLFLSKFSSHFLNPRPNVELFMGRTKLSEFSS